MPYNFQYVESVKVKLTNAELKDIEKLYEQWADDIQKDWSHKVSGNYSSTIKKTQMLQLRKALREQAKVISNQVEKYIKTNLYTISNSVVDNMLLSLSELGVNSKLLRANFASIPVNVVENLISGAIYGGQGNWRLSKAIWGDENKTLSNLYQIVASGVAENKGIYEIAKELSKFVNPRAARQWNLKTKDGRRIYPKKVDYASQRLARTLSQHAYQQTIVQTTINNPMILGIRWRANGSRVCDICKARDGHVYPKNELPLDHPNGMCVMEPIYLADSDEMIAKWVNSPAGTYPSMDNWAKELGYKFDGNNPSTPVANIMRNEDNAKVAKQNYKNDQGFDSSVWMEAEKEEDELLDKMRKEHTEYIKSNKTRNKAVVQYTGNNYYYDLNAWLRGDKTLGGMTARNAKRIPNLDKELHEAMAGSKVEEGIYLRRKGRFVEFQNVLGFEESDMALKKNEELLKDLNTRLSGKVFEINQYMSTSTKYGQFGFGSEWYIKANDNTHGMYVTEISEYGKREDEIIVDKGTKFKLNAIKKHEDFLRFYVEVIS